MAACVLTVGDWDHVRPNIPAECLRDSFIFWP